jgi:hypothetical protein
MKKLGFNYEPQKKGYYVGQKFKTHRCAMDFDHGFCKTIFKQEELTL